MSLLVLSEAAGAPGARAVLTPALLGAALDESHPKRNDRKKQLSFAGRAARAAAVRTGRAAWVAAVPAERANCAL